MRREMEKVSVVVDEKHKNTKKKEKIPREKLKIFHFVIVFPFGRRLSEFSYLFASLMAQ
jgi:hypothetical protein